MERHARLVTVRVGAVLATCALLVGCGGDDDATSTAASSSTTTQVPTTTEPPDDCGTSTTTSTTTTSTTTTSTTTTTSSTLPVVVVGPGDEGEAVLAMQVRLDELGYWLGEPDGVYGESTRHAVVALQKVADLETSGVVDDATRSALDEGVRPPARSEGGRVVEVDLSSQVLLIVTDGEVDLVLDTSTGRVPGTTPVGTWTINREIDGPRHAPLGLLHRPKYFYGGVAIHGYTSVPDAPASHGCVRLTYPAMDMVWARGLAPLGTTVLVYD